MRILLVEDEASIAGVVKLNLELEGYDVVHETNGLKAFDMTSRQHFDLIILDVMLPGLSGIEVCEQIRLLDHSTPIIMISAKDSSSDRIWGLKSGADDYLPKPFHLEELLLRIEKLIQRSKPSNEEALGVFKFGDNEVNLVSFEAKGVNGELLLTKKEAMLMKLFIEKRNQVVSRQQILQYVWGYDIFPSTRTVDNFILSLRKYFEKDLKKPKYFHAIRGIGYKFIA